jgi:D-aminoacyl-tRNA deacylase
MRVVLQRVISASVSINNHIHSSINNGLLIFIGIENNDTFEDMLLLTNKITNLRIFNDSNELMNLSIKDIHGEILVISQFTLFAKTQKGKRPSFVNAAKPEFAIPLYNSFIDNLGINSGLQVKSGVFGMDMKVQLINDGPVTIIIDSKNNVL